MSKKRKTLLGIIILVLVIVSGIVFSTIKSDTLPKSKNHEKVQEVLVSEEADSVVEAPTEKVFTYWGESDDVSVYLMEPEKNQYPAIEMGEGKYDDITWINGLIGKVTQINDILEFRHAYTYSCILPYNEVFQIEKDGTYKWMDRKLGEAFQLKTLLNSVYYQEERWEYNNEFYLSCFVSDGFEGTVLVKKNFTNGKETHFYFDDYYNMYFSENSNLKQSSYVYLTNDIQGEELNEKLEIWKYNLDDNSMELISEIEETYDEANITVNKKGEIFVLFSIFQEKTWGFFLDTKKSFELKLRAWEKRFFCEEGVYIYFSYWGGDVVEPPNLEKGLYLIQCDGNIKYIGGYEYAGTICDNLMITMLESEALDQREMYIIIHDMTNPSREVIKILYPPKKANNKTYYLAGWSCEKGKVYGYYVSEDCADVEKFVIN